MMHLPINAIERPELDRERLERVKLYTPSEIRHIRPEDLRYFCNSSRKGLIKEVSFYEIRDECHRKIGFDRAVEKGYLCLDVCIMEGSPETASPSSTITLSIVEFDIITQLLLDIQDSKIIDVPDFATPEPQRIYRLEELCSPAMLETAKGTKVRTYQNRSLCIIGLSLDIKYKPEPTRIEGSYEMIGAHKLLTGTDAE